VLGTYTLPVITISPASATICSLAQANLNATGASAYAWNTGAATASLSVNPASNTVYTVTGTSSQGCVSAQTVAVTTMSLPVMAIVPASATVCSQSMASFVASGASSYTWNSTVAAASLTMYPANSTVYSVTGINGQGCTATATVAVTTMSLPVISVLPAMSTVCVNSPVTFTASGAGTYTWNNGNTGSTAVISATAPANVYNISATDAGNGCVSSGNFYLFTNPLPVVSISASSGTVCSLSPVSFTAAGADSYNWSNGGTNDNITVNPASTTDYTVTGTIAATGCSNTQTVTVSANALPIVAISPANPAVCYKSSVTLTGSGAMNYVWSTSASGTSVSITPSVSATYTVTGTDANGCENSQTVAVTVNALPVINVQPIKTICVGQVATFTVSGASTYTWNGSQTGNSFTASPAFSSIYSYTVVGTDNNGCANKATTALDVEDCTGIRTNSYSGVMVSVYPNPSNGVFTASFDFAGEKTILIMDVSGKVVQQAVTASATEVFDISHMAKGVYFVRVSSKEASGNYKMVIE